MALTTGYPVSLQFADDLLNSLKAFRVIQCIICDNISDSFQNLHTSVLRRSYNLRRKHQMHLSPADHICCNLLNYIH